MDNKRYYKYQEIQDISENDGRELKLNELRHYNVKMAYRSGAIVKVRVDSKDNTSIYPKTAESIEFWKNEEQVRVWQAESESAGNEITLLNQQKKEGARKLHLEGLEHLHTAYCKCRTSRQQTMLLAQIITYITKGKTH